MRYWYYPWLVSSAARPAPQAPASVKSIRDAKIGTQWQVKQVEISFKTDTFVTVELTAGDKVDGYYYILSGDGISFNISGISQIYASPKTRPRIDSPSPPVRHRALIIS